MSNEPEPQRAAIRAMTATIEKISTSLPAVEASCCPADEAASLVRAASAKSPPASRPLLAAIAAALSGREDSLTIYTIESGGSLIAGDPSSAVSHVLVSGSAKIEGGPDAPALRELLPGDYAGAHAVLVSTSDKTKILAIPREIVARCAPTQPVSPARPVSLSGREVSRAVLDQALDVLIRERAATLLTERRGISSILNPWKQTYVDRVGERAVSLSEQHAIQLRAVELLAKHGSSEHEIRELALSCRKEAFLSAAISRDLTEALHACEAQIARLESRRSSPERGPSYGKTLDRDFRERAGALAEARKELDASLASLHKRRDKEIGVGKRDLLVQTAHELFVARAERTAVLTSLAARIADELEESGIPEERRAEVLAERFVSRGQILSPDSRDSLLEAALNFSSLLDHGLSPAEIRTMAERLLRIRWLERAALRICADRSVICCKGASGFQDDLFEVLRLATDRAQIGIQLDARLDTALAEAREAEDDIQSLQERLRGSEAPFSVLPASKDAILAERLLPHDSRSHIALERLRADFRAGRRSDYPGYALGIFSRSLLDCLAEGRLHCLVFAGSSEAALELALARYGEPREHCTMAPVPRLDGAACGALLSFPSGRQVLVLPCRDADDMLHLAAALVSHERAGSRIPRDRLELAGLPGALDASMTSELETLFYEDLKQRAVTGLMDLNEQLAVLGRRLHHAIVPTQLVFLEDPERDLRDLFGDDLEKGSRGERLAIYYARDKESGSVTRFVVPSEPSPLCGLAVTRCTEAFLDSEIGNKNPNVVIHFHARLRPLGLRSAPREGQLFASLGSEEDGADGLTSRISSSSLTALRASFRPSPLFMDPNGKDLALVDHVSGGIRSLARRHNRERAGLVRRFGPMTVSVLVTHRQDAGAGICSPRVAPSPIGSVRHALTPAAIGALRSVFAISCKEFRKHFSAQDFKA